MNINVELFGQLSQEGQRLVTMRLDKPCTVSQAASHLCLDVEMIGLITINGIQSELQDELSPDCRLCFFPYLSGGSITLVEPV
jgi:hypothetical protein